MSSKRLLSACVIFWASLLLLLGTAVSPARAVLPDEEIEALIGLWVLTNGSTWKVQDNWMKSDPCDFYGIRCENDHIVAIDLSGNLLSGPLPPELGNLSHLQSLDLSDNRITGQIPPELGELSALQVLNLSDNQLSGQIPETLMKLTSLEDGKSDFRNNDLSTADPDLAAFLSQKQIGGDWQGDPRSVLWFPHVAATAKWDTEIAVINPTDLPVSGVMEAYGANGEHLSLDQEILLNPHGRKQIRVDTDYADPQTIFYMGFRSDSPDLVGYTKFSIPNRYRVAVPAVSAVNSGDLYISHIASDAQWWTGIALVNTHDQPRSLRMVFDNGQSGTIILEPGEHRSFSIAGLFGDQPRPELKSAVIQGADGVIGLELFGSRDSAGNYLSGILLKNDLAQTIFYPHIASDAQWWTGLVAYNPSHEPIELNITPYSMDGQALSQPVGRTINGKGKYIGVVSALDLPAGTEWLRIQTEGWISGFELFGTRDQGQLAGYTGVGIGKTSGVFAKLESQGWTGIAFVNASDQTAQLRLTAYNDAGVEVAGQDFALGPYEKQVAMAPDLFSEDIAEASYIRFRSDRQVVGFQLNGTDDRIFLDGLPGL